MQQLNDSIILRLLETTTNPTSLSHASRRFHSLWTLSSARSNWLLRQNQDPTTALQSACTKHRDDGTVANLLARFTFTPHWLAHCLLDVCMLPAPTASYPSQPSSTTLPPSVVRALLAAAPDLEADMSLYLRAQLFGGPGSASSKIEIGWLLNEAYRAPYIQCGVAALFFASWRGHVDAVVALLDHVPAVGPRLDASALDHVALVVAARDGKADVVEVLLRHGASAKARDGLARKVASRGGYADVVKLLDDWAAAPFVSN
ncbi:hypothetical protein BDK51DRAFT_27658 [Blyttiomyces helicus]|uniref:Uncharacterized protein n=1 Tax=Blyttiomyces helicus TaxID=388810 RepID=A0A4P9WDQ3_9FUNG|nr:hypothetical protein BDK51DRAFT_27658 [Blyttiomyces helicus]|eukprot:RKO89865.1 hypothetical protein BDK51DRAFT_27658 [Blyttiomyces helicus]